MPGRGIPNIFDHNMKYLFLLSGAILLLLSACKSDNKSAGDQPGIHNDTRSLLAGHWVAMDFCRRANQYGSVLNAMKFSHVPYAYALTFDPNRPDSVICYNGMERWTLPVKFNADTIEMVGARPGKSVFLVYHSQGEKDMSMFDGTTGQVYLDNFVKSKSDVGNGYAAFTLALHHNLFSGVFGEIGKGAASKQEIQFNPDGFIINWKPYDVYAVCTAGDCFVMDNDMDVITLAKSADVNTQKMYGFKYSAQNDTLTLYNIADPTPEEKGGYVTKGVAYRFFRKKSQ